MALVAMTQCTCSTPTKVLEMTFDLPPVDLNVQEIAINKWLEIKSFVKTTWGGIGDRKEVVAVGHHKMWSNVLQSLPMANMPMDDIDPVPNWMRYDKIINPGVTIFTDGSKTDPDVQGEDGNAGYCWLATTGDAVLQEEMGYLGAMFKDELFAILTSLMWVQTTTRRKTPNWKSCLIKSDSQSAIQAIIADTIKSSLVLHIKQLIDLLKNEISIGIERVCGHTDVVRNELADMLAKKTTYGCSYGSI